MNQFLYCCTTLKFGEKKRNLLKYASYNKEIVHVGQI